MEIFEKRVSWSEFVAEAALERARTEAMRAAQEPFSVSELLFRGQARESWALTTTLERAMGVESGSFEYRCRRYFVDCYPTYVRLKSSPFKDEIPIMDYRFEAEGKTVLSTLLESMENMEFMVYLRQNGFPSPYLDWTSSIYTAAFFAFLGQGSDEDAAIYQCMPRTGVITARLATASRIISLGHQIVTDEKHYFQQAQYTLSLGQDKDGYTSFRSHEDPAALRDEGVEIKRYIIPSSERPEVIQQLGDMGITRYNLFRTRESLISQISDQVVWQAGSSGAVE